MSILVQYVDDVLTPTDNQTRFIKSKVESIKKVLKKNSPLPPKEVHLGGSLAKGTMLRHKLDADLIFIYNRNEEVANNWEKLTTIVYKPLKSNFPEGDVKKAENVAIHIKTALDGQPVNFDIVPGYSE